MELSRRLTERIHAYRFQRNRRRGGTVMDQVRRHSISHATLAIQTRFRRECSSRQHGLVVFRF